MHALHYTNELLVRVRLSFQKRSQTLRSNMQKQYNVWETSYDACSLSIRVQTTINIHSFIHKPHFDLFSTTISTSKKKIFFPSARRARAEKGIARHFDASSVVRLGTSNFWLVRSEHAHASYPRLSFRPPGFSPYMGRKERRVQELDYQMAYRSVSAT